MPPKWWNSLCNSKLKIQSYFIHTGLRPITDEYKIYFQRLHLNYLHIPAFIIKPLQCDLPEYKRYDAAIISSPTAATVFNQFNKELSIEKFFCVGAATAAALGVPAVVAKKPYGSEMLLQQPEISKLVGKRVLIVCGKNPRELIVKSLRENGVFVEVFYNYQRRPNPNFLDKMPENWQSSHLIVSGYSIQGIDVITDNLDVGNIEILVLNGRCFSFAKTKGFKKIMTIPFLSDSHIIAALQIKKNLFMQNLSRTQHL